MDISLIPFSMAGSYPALSERKKQHGSEASHDCLICSPQDGEWLAAVEDMGEGWLPQKRI